MDDKQGNIIILSGGFDPVHPGHIRMIQEAGAYCDLLFVGLNSDEWLKRKKGFVFQSRADRALIMKSIKGVFTTFSSWDDSDDSAYNLIHSISEFWSPNYLIVFGNGGDRTKDNIPEMKREYPSDVKFLFGIGGNNKYASSSEIGKRSD